MKEPLRTAHDAGSGLQRDGESGGADSALRGLRPGPAPVCRKKLSVASLREYLFDLKDGREADEEIEKHLAEGCVACEICCSQLNATTPSLYGWLEPKFVAKEEIPPPDALRVIQEEGKKQARESSVEEFAGKLASFVATPAQPLTLERLADWNERLRQIRNHEEAQAFGGRIHSICVARWARLGTKVQEVVEKATEDLYTALEGGDSGYKKAEPNVGEEGQDAHYLPQSISGKETERQAFLVYLMSFAWFLNANERRTWAIKGEGGGKEVVLFFDEIRKALRMGRVVVKANKVPVAAEDALPRDV